MARAADSTIKYEFSESFKERSVILYGKFPVQLEVMDRLSRRDLNVELCGSWGQVKKMLDQNKVSLAIVADCDLFPFFVTIRRIIQHPVGHLVPIMPVASAAPSELLKIVDSINLSHRPQIRDYHNPGNLVSEVRVLGQYWSSPSYLPLVVARDMILKENWGVAIELLSRAKDLPAHQSPVISATAKIHMQIQSFTEAEQVLLDALSNKKANLRILVTLLELYLSYSMLSMAERVMDRIAEHFGTYIGLSIDKLQSLLMAQQYEHAVPMLEAMITKKFAAGWAKRNLEKIYFSSGYAKELSELGKTGDISVSQLNKDLIVKAS